jgi:hypothetical protein
MATRMTPIIANLIAQRIASLAIRKKMASRTTPAIRKMVVKVIDASVASHESPVVSHQSSVIIHQSSSVTSRDL